MKIAITQSTEKKFNHNGERYVDTETLCGDVTNFEDVTVLIGLITNIFPNVDIKVSTNNIEEG